MPYLVCACKAPSTHLLIAALALAHGVPLLHCDQQFDLMAEVANPLRFWPV